MHQNFLFFSVKKKKKKKKHIYARVRAYTYVRTYVHAHAHATPRGRAGINSTTWLLAVIFPAEIERRTWPTTVDVSLGEFAISREYASN